jgi:3-dehydroquinate synthase
VREINIKSHFFSYSAIFVDCAHRYLQGLVCDKDIILIDRNVLTCYPSLGVFPKAKGLVTIDASEEVKSYVGLVPTLNRLMEIGVKRENRLIAIGGGVTQDVTAFLSSILFRGVEWLFVPTTLLAQADSCIGGKSSVNFGEAKNQLGTFLPPKRVVIDTNLLATLTREDWLSGLGEIAHYFILDKPSTFRRLGDFLSKADLKSDPDVNRLIADSLNIKKRFIEVDEFDVGRRQLLNYGHSFGHAIESATAYAMPHGIAVAHGIDIANRCAVSLGFLEKDIQEEINMVLAKICRAYDMGDISPDAIFCHLKKDKKNSENSLRLILCHDFGSVVKHSFVIDDELRGMLTNSVREHTR